MEPSEEKRGLTTRCTGLASLAGERKGWAAEGNVFARSSGELAAAQRAEPHARSSAAASPVLQAESSGLQNLANAHAAFATLPEAQRRPDASTGL